MRRGSDYTEQLLRVIDADQLPDFLGGTYKTGEELGPITHGQEMAHVVPAGDRWNTQVCIEGGGLAVSWVWRTVSGQDLGFEVRFRLKGGGGEEIVQRMCRNEENGEPVLGHYESVAEGSLILEWSNEHSWMTSKDLRYTIEVNGESANECAEPAPELAPLKAS